MSKFRIFKKNIFGFSSLEIVISIFIVGTIAAGIFASFMSFRRLQSVKADVNKVAAVIKEARSKTLASKDFSQYGIHFDAGQAVLFKGTSYSANDSSNATTTLSSTAEISTISLSGGGGNVIFKRLTGITDNYGYVILRDKNNTTETSRINIGNAGVIEIQ